MLAETAASAAPTPASESDARLARQLRQALHNIEPLRLLHSPLEVTVEDGVVTIRGVVASVSVWTQIRTAVQEVAEGHEVRAELLTEADLEVQTAQALATDPRTRHAAAGIYVNAVNDRVVLSGRVPTADVAEAAAAIASEVPGVHRVNNRLHVTSVEAQAA